MVADEIAKAMSAYLQNEKKHPTRILLSKEKLDQLGLERPEVLKEGHLWGTRIELAWEGHPILAL